MGRRCHDDVSSQFKQTEEGNPLHPILMPVKMESIQRTSSSFLVFAASLESGDG
jgi:hypothetical protein